MNEQSSAVLDRLVAHVPEEYSVVSLICTNDAGDMKFLYTLVADSEMEQLLVSALKHVRGRRAPATLQ